VTPHQNVVQTSTRAGHHQQLHSTQPAPLVTIVIRAG